jgi:hypothetical protein
MRESTSPNDMEKNSVDVNFATGAERPDENYVIDDYLTAGEVRNFYLQNGGTQESVNRIFVKGRTPDQIIADLLNEKEKESSGLRGIFSIFKKTAAAETLLSIEKLPYRNAFAEAYASAMTSRNTNAGAAAAPVFRR